MIERAIHHIRKTAEIPSFSTFEERLHPYIRSVFPELDAREIEAEGNNLIFYLGDGGEPEIALAAHIDKINHYGSDYPDTLPVEVKGGSIKGAMDDSAGVGTILTLAEHFEDRNWSNMLLFFSEMEESKGLKEHPELLRNSGDGYTHGMGARMIANTCLEKNYTPKQIITVDTTPLFKGDSGIALYSKHWEYNDLVPDEELKEATINAVEAFKAIEPDIKLDNNTNDYLHYGEVFNKNVDWPVVSMALEPAIYPYHQKGEKVYISDIEKTLNILDNYLNSWSD